MAKTVVATWKFWFRKILLVKRIFSFLIYLPCAFRGLVSSHTLTKLTWWGIALSTYNAYKNRPAKEYIYIYWHKPQHNRECWLWKSLHHQVLALSAASLSITNLMIWSSVSYALHSSSADGKKSSHGLCKRLYASFTLRQFLHKTNVGNL